MNVGMSTWERFVGQESVLDALLSDSRAVVQERLAVVQPKVVRHIQILIAVVVVVLPRGGKAKAAIVFIETYLRGDVGEAPVRCVITVNVVAEQYVLSCIVCIVIDDSRIHSGDRFVT